jgi:hypothetical protein
MEKEVSKIMEILENVDKDSQRKILIECAAKLGSKEWEEAVSDFWKRMKDIEKKK